MLWNRKKKRQKMLKLRNLLFIASLTLAATACSTKCAQVNYNFCPAYPIAGAEVAAELEKASTEEYPATWEWIGRVDKLRQELEICKLSVSD